MVAKWTLIVALSFALVVYMLPVGVVCLAFHVVGFPAKAEAARTYSGTLSTGAPDRESDRISAADWMIPIMGHTEPPSRHHQLRLPFDRR